MNGKTIVTQRDDFECSYIMRMESDGLQLHSHHYKVEVSVSGNQRIEDNGVILEFNQFKNLLRSVLPDHMFLFNADRKTNCPEEENIQSVLIQNGLPVKKIYFSPSAENLVNYIVVCLQNKFDQDCPGVTIVDAKLRESTDSFAQWSK